MDIVKFGEIVYCDLIIKHKGKTHELKGVVHKNKDGLFYNRRVLGEINIKEPVEVESVNVISRLGFENKSTEYTEVKGSDEKRNKTTGAYE